LPTYGGIYAWEFEKRGRALKVRVEGPLVFNNMAQRMNAVLAGIGLAYLPEDQVAAHIVGGRLIRVLASPLLPEPPPDCAGICAVGRGAAIPPVIFSAAPSKRAAATPQPSLSLGRVRH
jgi:DNA-binding transcriptional LysR family regulator